MPACWCQVCLCRELWSRYWGHLYISQRNLWEWKVSSSPWPFTFLYHVCRPLPLAKPGGNLKHSKLSTLYSGHPHACLCVEVLERWGQGRSNEPAAIFLIAAYHIQMCFLFRAKVQRGWLCLRDVSNQQCSWCVCGRGGLQREGRSVAMSAMWTRVQGEAFGLLFAVLTLEPSAIPVCLSPWLVSLLLATAFPDSSKQKSLK